MKITYLKLKNFVNIKVGMKKTEIEIDFNKSSNKLVLLCGPNGSGKTSLLSELHPFANSGNMDVRGETNLIIEGKDGYKEIHIQDNEDKYIIKHFYMFSKKTKSVKSFITKNDVELNPNGNVKSFKEAVFDNLGIDQELLKLMRLGSNVTSLINMKSTNRKNFATKLFSDIEVYQGFYKKVSDEYRNVRAVLKSTADKISKFNIQDESEFTKQLELTNHEIDKYTIEKDDLQKSLVLLEDTIKNIDLSDEELVVEKYNSLKRELDYAYDSIALITDVTMSKNDFKLMYEKEKQNIEMKLLECKSNIDKAISERDIYYNQKQDLEESLKRAASKERIEHLRNTIINYKNEIDSLEKELKDRTNYDKMDLLLFKDHCQKTLDYIRDLNIYSEYDIKRVMESVINNDNLMKSLETKNINNKSTYEILNAEIINIEKMNIDFDLDLGDDKCTKDCPYKQFYLQTIGRKNNLNHLIEERNKLNKEILKYEEIFNLYNNIIFIKNHISSYEGKQFVPYDYTDCFTNFIIDKPVVNTNLLNLFIDDSEKFERMNKLKNDLKSFETEYELIKSSGLDVIEIENKILSIDEIIDVKNKTIDSNSISKNNLENQLQLYIESSEATLEALTIKESIKSLEEQYNEVSERYDEITELKNTKLIYSEDLIKGKNQFIKLKEFIDNLIVKKNQISFNEETYKSLVNEYNALKLLFEDAEEIKDALNSSKGIPLIFLQVYLKNCPIMMNSLLDTIYEGELQIEGFIIDENEFRIPYIKSGIRIPDIVMASQGESSFISIVLSLSLIIQSMTKYDIICLDELDGPLDTKNREEFIKVLYSFIEQTNSEQIFLISHNNLFESEPIDLITTGNVDIESFKQSNIIFRP
jgi:DNA repair exonuclease SbcCD ATPase subunit